ncbi:hypothetical protein BBJ28_00003530 [Nothophytophthora sp. Chile5]|nr:hypothetical protein BBJ28_00003530 [Nothophytophthora sp. Chile5]
MGSAASVALPPERTATVRHASRVALEQGRHAVVVAQVGLVRVVRVAEQWYAVVDERVISRVHRVVERQVVRRINLLADHIEVASKHWFVKSISTTSIAQAFDIDAKEYVALGSEIGKRDYEVFTCGPELLDVPSWGKGTRVLELKDPHVTDFLLNKCLWAEWQPPASWRVKVDQVFDMTLHVEVRRQGFLTNEIRVVRLRVGRKWVGAHHLSKDTPHTMKSQWLHRVDYELSHQVEVAESEFFQTVKAAWEAYLVELSKLPQEDFQAADKASNGFPYDEQEQHPSLRVKYLLDTSLENIMNDQRTLFRTPHLFELWRMEQEDAPEHRQDCMEDHMSGPLLNGPIDDIIELYEGQSMTAEDKDITWS